MQVRNTLVYLLPAIAITMGDSGRVNVIPMIVTPQHAYYLLSMPETTRKTKNASALEIAIQGSTESRVRRMRHYVA